MVAPHVAILRILIGESSSTSRSVTAHVRLFAVRRSALEGTPFTSRVGRHACRGWWYESLPELVQTITAELLVFSAQPSGYS